MVPSIIPTYIPTYGPTYTPSIIPTYIPTYGPTYTQTIIPTYGPTYGPTYTPSIIPTYGPTIIPSYVPTYVPTNENATVNNVNSNIFKTNGPKMYSIIFCIILSGAVIICGIYKYYTKKVTDKNEIEFDTIYDKHSEPETTDRNSFIINPLSYDRTSYDFYRRSIDL
jgi:hypothetical protein